MTDHFEIDWGSVTLVQPGVYEAVYVSHETLRGSFGPKLKITFRIVTPGPYFETMISGWYNLKDTSGKPGKRGKVIASRHSKFITEMLKVLDIKQRPSRVSPIQLKGKILEISVRTVKTNSRQKAYSELQIYSVVDSINRLLSHDRIEIVKSTTNHNKPLPKPIPEPIPTSKPEEVHDKRHLSRGRTCQETNLALEIGK